MLAGKYTNLGHFYIQLTCSVCLINCCFIKYFAVVLFPFDTSKLSNLDLSLRLCVQSIYIPQTLHLLNLLNLVNLLSHLQRWEGQLGQPKASHQPDMDQLLPIRWMSIVKLGNCWSQFQRRLMLYMAIYLIGSFHWHYSFIFIVIWLYLIDQNYCIVTWTVSALRPGTLYCCVYLLILCQTKRLWWEFEDKFCFSKRRSKRRVSMKSLVFSTILVTIF